MHKKVEFLFINDKVYLNYQLRGLTIKFSFVIKSAHKAVGQATPLPAIFTMANSG